MTIRQQWMYTLGSTLRPPRDWAFHVVLSLILTGLIFVVVQKKTTYYNTAVILSRLFFMTKACLPRGSHCLPKSLTEKKTDGFESGHPHRCMSRAAAPTRTKAHTVNSRGFWGMQSTTLYRNIITICTLKMYVNDPNISGHMGSGIYVGAR